MVRLDAVSPQDAPQSTLPVNADTLPVATPVTLPVNADILPVTLPVVNSLFGRLLQVLDHETGVLRHIVQDWEPPCADVLPR